MIFGLGIRSFGDFNTLRYSTKQWRRTVISINFVIRNKVSTDFPQGPRCTGDDSCCDSDNPCREMEGDCDYDSDCFGPMVCGSNNCPNELFFEDTDDCCEIPSRPETHRNKRKSSSRKKKKKKTSKLSKAVKAGKKLLGKVKRATSSSSGSSRRSG